MTSEAQKRAKEKYDRANTVSMTIKLNRKTDEDVISFLNGCENRQGAIKAIIREHLKTHS